MHPVLLHLGSLILPAYGAFLALGLMLALGLSLRTAPLAGLAPEGLWTAGLAAVLSAFLASRGLLIVENWRAFLQFPLLVLALPSLSAGGLLLATLFTLLWLRAHRISLEQALEAWTPCGLVLWGFLTLGHFAEGSDPGLPTISPWGVRVPGASYAEQPVALLAAFAAFTLAVWCLARLRQRRRVAGPALLAAGCSQVLFSFLRQPSPQAAAGLDMLQWAGAGLALAGGFLIALEAARTYRHP